MLLGDMPQFRKDAKVRIAGPRIGANSDANTASEHIGEWIRAVRKIGLRPGAVDHSHFLSTGGYELHFLLDEKVAMNNQCLVRLGEHFQIIQWAESPRQ